MALNLQTVHDVAGSSRKTGEKKPRSLRSRSYLMERLKIGTFIADTRDQSSCSNKIRFYFVQKKMVYDFEFEFWIDEVPYKFLAAICIPFDTITGICCRNKELYFDVSSPPRLVIGSTGSHSEPPPVDIDITGGQLEVIGRHKINLARAQGYLIQQHLQTCREFSDLFMDVDAPLVPFQTNSPSSIVHTAPGDAAIGEKSVDTVDFDGDERMDNE